jgi:hypothetical protein
MNSFAPHIPVQKITVADVLMEGRNQWLKPIETALMYSYALWIG